MQAPKFGASMHWAPMPLKVALLHPKLRMVDICSPARSLYAIVGEQHRHPWLFCSHRGRSHVSNSGICHSSQVTTAAKPKFTLGDHLEACPAKYAISPVWAPPTACCSRRETKEANDYSYSYPCVRVLPYYSRRSKTSTCKSVLDLHVVNDQELRLSRLGVRTRRHYH